MTSLTRESNSAMDLRFEPMWNQLINRATVEFRNGNHGSVDDGSVDGVVGGVEVGINRSDERQRSSREIEASRSCVGRLGKNL